MKKIVLTGGGTAGHATPNIALIPRLTELGYDITYIGSKTGIEKKLIADFGLPYYGVSSGKFRRYFDLKNLTDPFRVLKGIGDAKRILKKIQPDIVFSKGGFVAVPVVRAARSLKIPIIIHESDMTPGLANRLCIPLAEKVCCTFPETMNSLPEGKAVLTGTPIRAELLNGSRENGLAFTGFDGKKIVLLVIGGSLGATPVNDAVRKALPEILQKCDVIHLCGRGKMDSSLNHQEGYRQYEYIKKELPDLFAAADIVISRAGANAICELLSLRKPNLLIPLSAAASRGDQILNAESFEKRGFSVVVKEEDLTTETLMAGLHNLYQNRGKYIAAMEGAKAADPIGKITALIEECTNNSGT